jgi:nucleotide-binding universal stress UspA family protein
MAYGYLTPFFPAVPVLAVVIQLMIASQMLHFSADVLFTAVGWLVAGGLVYGAYSRRRVRELEPVPVVVAERTVLEGPSGKPPVVLPISRPYGIEGLVKTAAGIARTLDRHVLLLHVVTVPEQLPISSGIGLVEEGREEVRDVARALRDEGVEVELVIRLAHRPATAIVRTLQDRGADFCVLGWRGRTHGRNRILGSNLDAILREANCNFVVMQELAGPVRKVIFPASNPRQAHVAFALGSSLARALGAQTMDIVTIFPRDVAPGEVEDRMEEMREAIGGAAGLPPGPWQDALSVDGMTVTFRDDYSHEPQARILELSRGFDLMLLGAGPGAVARRDVLGRVTWSLATQARCPVVAVKRRTGGLHFQVQSFFDFFYDEVPESEADNAAGDREPTSAEDDPEGAAHGRAEGGGPGAGATLEPEEDPHASP